VLAKSSNPLYNHKELSGFSLGRYASIKSYESRQVRKKAAISSVFM